MQDFFDRPNSPRGLFFIKSNAACLPDGDGFCELGKAFLGQGACGDYGEAGAALFGYDKFVEGDALLRIGKGHIEAGHGGAVYFDFADFVLFNGNASRLSWLSRFEEESSK